MEQHASLAFFSSPSFFPRRSLLETDAYRETDKRHRGLMILRRRLGRIMRDLRARMNWNQCRPRVIIPLFCYSACVNMSGYR